MKTALEIGAVLLVFLVIAVLVVAWGYWIEFRLKKTIGKPSDPADRYREYTEYMRPKRPMRPKYDDYDYDKRPQRPGRPRYDDSQD